ncbi:MAG: glycerol-3-phosphate 1-O-acyltransferase PlsY [bacterium]
MLKFTALVIFSYFLGSFPSAYLAGKIRKGIDIRQEGSRNAGAANVLVVIGPIFAALVYVTDLLKGLIPVLLARNIMGTDVSMGLCGLAAILGHDFPIFIKFSGGKGVATTTGAMFGIHSLIMTILLFAWIFFVALTNYFILSSLICMLLIPILMYLFKLSNTFMIFGFLYFLAGLFTHRKDVVRIFSGQHPTAFNSIKKYFRI